MRVLTTRRRTLIDALETQLARSRWRPTPRHGNRSTLLSAARMTFPDLAAAVVHHGGRLLALIPQRESLEDLFIRVVEEK